MPERLKYLALGVLFVNVSIGGTLTSYAAPPVLMAASTWQWDSAFMLATFGWKAAVARADQCHRLYRLCCRHLPHASALEAGRQAPVPAAVACVHILLLAGVVLFAHHPVVFLGLFCFWVLPRPRAPPEPADPGAEALLVGFFSWPVWWCWAVCSNGGFPQPIVSGLEPLALFAGARWASRPITDANGAGPTRAR